LANRGKVSCQDNLAPTASEAALQERVKELTALHCAVHLLQLDRRSLSDILCDFAALLPPAWQYPEIASARVVYDAAECATPDFASTPWMQVAEFDDGRGRIEVAYREERPAAAEGPFLAEERTLLNSLAELLGVYVRRNVSEQSLGQQARTLEAVLSASADRHFLMARDGRYLYTDEGGARTIGRKREEIIGRTWQEMGFPAEDFQKVDQQRSVVLATGKPVTGEMVFPSPDGPRDFAYILTPVKDESGEVESVLATARDITERKAADSTRAQLAMAVEQAAEAIIITDCDANIVYVNPAFERTTGYTSAEVLGRNPNLLSSGLQPPEYYEEMWRIIQKGNVWSGKFTNRRKDGSLFHEEATISPVRDAAGKIINYVAVKRDVSRERELELQFLQAQKMEAVGRLAGGVAHDFNNLLAVILGYSEMALESMPDSHPLRHGVEEISRAADRAAGLTRQLLAFSRQQVLQPRVINLNTVVSDVEKMMRRLIGEDIQFMTRLEPELGMVKADPGQIEQVLMNLVVNARDAMPGGGRLIVETSNIILDAAYAECHHPVQPGSYIRLTVSDTGHGMDEETQKKIFEPFFTTKEKGKGTGLGLATVYGIVKQSGGFIWVYSEPGHGTTFKIYLPRVEQNTVEVVKEKERFADAPRGTETILLAEDSDALRELNREFLTALGYTVLEARDGQEALQRFTGHGGPIHLLATDVAMPVMGGRELAQRIIQIRPDMKTLFMSGYTDEAIQLSIRWDPGTQYLQKPFRPTELAARVREILDVKPATPADS